MSYVIYGLFVLLMAILLCIRLLVRRALPLKAPISTLIVLGSGGHTSEMFSLIQTLDIGGQYQPVNFLASADDALSIRRFEDSKLRWKGSDIIPVRRSRRVGQSYLTSIFSTLSAIYEAAFLYIRYRPDLIICNGPGTCVPICLIAKLYPFKRTAVVFIESICKVNSLSLTGSILYYIADHFVVQWESLQKKYRRAKYIGRIVY